MASSLNSHSLLCLLILAIFTSSEAKDFLVGGNENAWRVPPTTTDSLNQWAENNRFQVGDSLVWKYDAGKDSVLQVNREAYLSCNKSSPIAEHKDGATVVELRRSGAYYFISGAEGACEEGEKLIVVVLSDRHSLRALGLAPAPAPAEYEGPAVAPTSGAARSTAAVALSNGMMVVLGILLRTMN